MRTTPATEASVPAPSPAPNLAEGSPGALPNLVVVGAQKCGTSALHFYLSLHPEIAMSETKELNFFIKRRNWRLGLDWYRSHFNPEAPVRGESSPNYSAHPLFRGVPNRMHQVIPEAKLIYLVRDPLDRIGAHWVHNYASGRTRQDLNEVVVRYRKTYVARSRYHMQLRRFLRRYPMERILVLDQADLRDERTETMRRVFEFVGVDPGFTHPHFRRERHRTERKARYTRLGKVIARRRERSDRRILPEQAWAVARERWPIARPVERPDVHELLPDKVIANLRRDAERLRDLTGRGFEHWSIWDL